MSLVLNESLVLAKTRSQDLKSVLRLNCWGSGIKDVSLVRELVNVEVIGLSCNEVSTLKDFAYCQKLRELILRKNNIKNISEISHLQGLPNLTNLWLEENPCVESTHNYRKVVIRALPQLKVLDNKPITREELQEIEELGDEIYEEVQCEYSSAGSSSGPPSNNVTNVQPKTTAEQQHHHQPEEQSQDQVNTGDFSEASLFGPTHQLSESQLNGTVTSINHVSLNDSVQNKSISNSRGQQFHQSSRCLSSQGSMNALNGHHQSWAMQSNNNNNLLPKGGRSRNGNILSAVLCLVKELDYTSCEVVQTALHCRMEETSQ